MPTASILPELGESLCSWDCDGLGWEDGDASLPCMRCGPARKPPTRAEDKLRLQAAGRRKLEEFRARRAAGKLGASQSRFSTGRRASKELERAPGSTVTPL
jgi:hypothetical protein